MRTRAWVALVPPSHIRPYSTFQSWRCSCCFIERHTFTAQKVAVTVNPGALSLAAGLFVKVSIAGHVNIIDISDSLLDGQRIHARIDMYVAMGDIALYAKKKDDDDHDLYISFTLNVSLFGHITQSDFFLATLP